MKTIHHFIIFLACCFMSAAIAEEARNWTHATSGKALSGTLLSKSADNSEAKVKRENSDVVVSLKTKDLSAADQDYVKNWSPPKPAGIVLKRVTALSQAQGGKSIVMEELGKVLKDYGIAENDTKAHPDAIIYKGPQLTEGGSSNAVVKYLMPLNEAEGQLLPHTGIVSRRDAVVPGFPPGMRLHAYDIRYGVYNRMVIVTDQAAQVVALQIKTEAKDDPTIPTEPEWRKVLEPMNTSDFINTRTGDGWFAGVKDLRKKEKRIIIDTTARPGKGECVLFIPVPMINLCLYHIEQDFRKN